MPQFWIDWQQWWLTFWINHPNIWWTIIIAVFVIYGLQIFWTWWKRWNS